MERSRPRAARALALAAAAVTLAPIALGQVVDPADAQRPPGQEEVDDGDRLRSWELPPLYVSAEREGGLREEDLIGSYQQPRWTARRLFPSTRVHVRPARQFELEHWTRVKVPRDGGGTTVETMYEAETGDAREHEYGLTLGVAHTLVDERLSLGAEVKAALLDEAADRGDDSKELELGPSLQYRPVPAMHVDLAPLVGIGPDSRAADIYPVLGWEF